LLPVAVTVREPGGDEIAPDACSAAAAVRGMRRVLARRQAGLGIPADRAGWLLQSALPA
jgi:hypothetical protein